MVFDLVGIRSLDDDIKGEGAGGGRGDVAEMMHCLVIISMMVVMV